MAGKGRPGISLTREEIEDALEEAKGVKQRAAELCDCSYTTFIREMRKHLEKENGTRYVETQPDITTAKAKTRKTKALEMETFEIDSFIDDMEKADKRGLPSLGYREVNFEFDTDILVAIIGDTHIGNQFTRHKQLGLDVKWLHNRPKTVVLLAGDYIDNYGKRSVGSGIHEQVYTIPQQKQRIEFIVKYLKKQILAIIQGCHDDWSMINDAFDLSHYLSGKDVLGYWLGKGGYINCKLGSQKYRIYLRHRNYYHSNYNLGHGIKKSNDILGDFDIGVGAHHHIPHIEQCWHRGKRLSIVRCSSYKKYDRFTEKIEKCEAPMCTPCFILRKDTWNVELYWNMRDAYKKL